VFWKGMLHKYLTLAHFHWVFCGVDSYLPQFTSSHGQSLLLIHTTKNQWKSVFLQHQLKIVDRKD
jgi:hypothetical protein